GRPGRHGRRLTEFAFKNERRRNASMGVKIGGGPLGSLSGPSRSAICTKTSLSVPSASRSIPRFHRLGSSRPQGFRLIRLATKGRRLQRVFADRSSGVLTSGPFDRLRRTDGVERIGTILLEEDVVRTKAIRGGRDGSPCPALDCSHLSSRHTSAGAPFASNVPRTLRFRAEADGRGSQPSFVSGEVSRWRNPPWLCRLQAPGIQRMPVSLFNTTARGPNGFGPFRRPASVPAGVSAKNYRGSVRQGDQLNQAET